MIPKALLHHLQIWGSGDQGRVAGIFEMQMYSIQEKIDD
jgi:hypothetical protein